LKNIIRKITNRIIQSELLKGTSTALLMRIVSLGVQYLFILILAKILGASAVGIFSLLYIILQLSGIISRVGTNTAILKFTGELTAKNEWEKLKTLLLQSYIITIIVGAVISFSVYLYADMISSFLNKSYLTSYIRIISLSIVPFSLLFINYEFLRGRKKIGLYVSLQGAIPFLIATLVALVFISLGVSLIAIPYSILVSFIGTFLISTYFLIKFIPNKTLPKLDIPWKVLTTVAFPLMIVSTVSYMMGWIDTIILGIYKNEADVGVYTVCLKIATLTSLPLVAVNSIAAPKFAEHWGQKDFLAIKKIANNSTKLIFLTSLPLLIIILLFPSFILSIFGVEFINGRTALMIITCAQFINAISGSVGFLLQMTDYQKNFQFIIIVATIINISLSYFFIPIYGIEGAALATATCLIFWNIASVIFVRMKFKFWIFNFFSNE
jgi:O-antigen/teichoic acid export membrane protein